MSITVLLADDHRVICDGLGVLLDSEMDISVVNKAADGLEAVRLVDELKPDIVIMDITMPKLNGIEATQLITETNPSTRVIILSMYATSEYIFRALHAGAKGYLLKESAGTEVVEAVRAVHSGGRFLSHKIADTVIEDYIRLHNLDIDDDPLSLLSPREREVLQLVVEGLTSVEIAQLLSLSPKTVETYRSRIMQKLEIHDMPSLVKFAIQRGLSQLE
ncbi:MAG: DNA-binding response regulator [Chloroflexi bacterium RBG_16_48_8]|nr:MAG: DNA-binding response regulator [Chloroflexi bacterium RBG_16_48_8]